MESLIIIFLLLGPILDVTTFYNLPINIIVRGLYLLCAIILMVKNKKNMKLLIPLLVFSIVEALFQKYYLGFSYLETISNIFKFLYLPISILFFKDLEFKKYSKERILSIIIFTYIGIYFFSYVTRIGESAYVLSDGKSGFKGLFSSINEFSGIIVGLLPIVTTYLKNRKNYLLLLILLLGSIICSLLIGTKVLLGGIIITIIYLLYQEKDNIYGKRKRIDKILIILFLVVITILSLFLFTKTRIYQNMLVQQSFFKANNFYDFLNHIIFNDRLSFLSTNFNYFKNTNIVNYLLGIGINDYSVKFVEIDIFDILFRYGIIGFLLFGYILIKIPFKELKGYEKLSLILFIIISLTSGHVLIYPNVCIYIALLTLKNMIE